MFDISWSELLLIAVVALVFIGPKELPGVLRTVGQWTGKIRRMASEFQDQFREAIREAEVADLKKDIDEATSSLKSGLDPFAGINESAEWKHSEPAASASSSSAAAADAPPAPPAEAIEPTAASTAPAEPAPAPAEPAPAASHEAAAEPAAKSEPAPANGGQAA